MAEGVETVCLNTGATLYGHAAGMNPNLENNERNTVVLFGELGNRMRADEPGAIFPVKLEIVADDTPSAWSDRVDRRSARWA